MEKPNGALSKGQIVLGLAFGIGCIWFFAAHDSSGTQPKQTNSASPTTPASAPSNNDVNAPATTPDSDPSRPLVLQASKLVEAVEQAKPDMSDEQNNISKGAVEIGAWAMSSLKWSELTNLPKTRPLLVLKDSESERGKLICAAGQIIEIKAEQAGPGKIFEGELGDPQDEAIYRFVAVKSTGELVEGSQAVFCGITIGRFDYSNSMNGVTHAIQLVGMFKLPENTRN
jgi:hypothetical protein